MGKLRQKKTNYNDEAIKALIEKYGFKKDYIYKSIRGERVGTYPLIIQEEYKALCREANNAIQSKINSI